MRREKNQAVTARGNFERLLRKNPYPGRIIVAGLDETSQHLIQIYGVMGRSSGSRGRVLEEDEGVVRTALTDPSVGGDHALTVYTAMRSAGVHHVVSNGQQTDTVVNLTDGGYRRSLLSTLSKWQYEPDAPNFTPRITAATSLAGEFGSRTSVQMTILRKSPQDETCVRDSHVFTDLPAGMGWCITTYAGDGNPLPSFRGPPLPVPLAGDVEKIAQTYWEALNRDNRVALAVKSIDARTGQSKVRIINQYQKRA